MSPCPSDHRRAQGSKTHTLDPARRILTTADTAGPTLTNHYTAADDNPAWIGSSDGTWTRYLHAPAGGLALTVDNTGAVVLNLANLHGDIVATAAPHRHRPRHLHRNHRIRPTRRPHRPRPPLRPARHPPPQHRRHPRPAHPHGFRLYNPTTGRFLSVDPVPGGSCNDYDYTCADPINALDLDGKRWCVFRKCFGSRKQPRYGSCGTCYVRRAAEGYHRARIRVCAWTTGFSGHVFGGFLGIRYAQMTFRRSGGYWWGFTTYCYWRY